MTTTPERISDLIDAHSDAHRDLLDFSTALDDRVAAKEQQVNQFLAEAEPEKRMVQTLKIEGSSNYFYPVWFRFPGHEFGVGRLTVSRHYGWNPGTLHATHIAALLLELEGNAHAWSGDACFLDVKRFHERYQTSCSHVGFAGYARYKREGAEHQNQTEDAVDYRMPVYSTLYLRGGGLEYRFSANWAINLQHALTTTRAYRSEAHGSWYVEPIALADQDKPEGRVLNGSSLF